MTTEYTMNGRDFSLLAFGSAVKYASLLAGAYSAIVCKDFESAALAGAFFVCGTLAENVARENTMRVRFRSLEKTLLEHLNILNVQNE